jgi:hypothetical protein
MKTGKTKKNIHAVKWGIRTKPVGGRGGPRLRLGAAGACESCDDPEDLRALGAGDEAHNDSSP